MAPQILIGGVLRELTPDEQANYDATQAEAAANRVPAAVTAQRSLLNAACDVAIESGFVSSALGTPHTYPSKRDDQINLMGLALAGSGGPFDANDGNGQVMKIHTAPQITQVLADGKAHKEAMIGQCKTLKAQVEAIAAGGGTDDAKIAAIEAVVWVNPV